MIDLRDFNEAVIDAQNEPYTLTRTSERCFQLAKEYAIQELGQLKIELERDIDTCRGIGDWSKIDGTKEAIARINISILNLKQ